MIAARNGELKSRFVLDISRLDELNRIERVDGLCAVGAGVTYRNLQFAGNIHIRSIAGPAAKNCGKSTNPQSWDNWR